MCEVDLSVKIGNLCLKNPVMPASGTFGYGEEFSEFFNLDILGAIVTKGISVKPKEGNKPPRIFEGEKYLMNSIGLENSGIEDFLKMKVPFLKNLKCAKIVNFFGNSEEEYFEIAEKLNNIESIDGIEINLSCPNVKKGGLEFGLNENFIYEITKNIVRIADKKVVMVKISPLSSNISSVGKAAEEAGADAITAINTVKGLRVDIENMEPSLGNVFGGISGYLLKPAALRIVAELKEAVNIPIIGAGGIFDFKDAVEFLACGATAVQVGTANFANPFVMPEIIKGLSNYLKEKGLKSIGELKTCLN